MTAGTASQTGFITVVVLSLAGCVGLLGILIVTSRVLRQWLSRSRSSAGPER